MLCFGGPTSLSLSRSSLTFQLAKPALPWVAQNCLRFLHKTFPNNPWVVGTVPEILQDPSTQFQRSFQMVGLCSDQTGCVDVQASLPSARGESCCVHMIHPMWGTTRHAFGGLRTSLQRNLVFAAEEPPEIRDCAQETVLLGDPCFLGSSRVKRKDSDSCL